MAREHLIYGLMRPARSHYFTVWRLEIFEFETPAVKDGSSRLCIILHIIFSQSLPCLQQSKVSYAKMHKVMHKRDMATRLKLEERVFACFVFLLSVVCQG